jgi:hypothetical protein
MVESDFVKKVGISTSCVGDLRQSKHIQKKMEEFSLAYYAQLMRHDWHVKVHRRVQQRGWGR